MQILAKFETRQSLFSFKGIAEVADGIIMSRGNLGLDVVSEKMALIQKAGASHPLLQRPSSYASHSQS